MAKPPPFPPAKKGAKKGAKKAKRKATPAAKKQAINTMLASGYGQQQGPPPMLAARR